MSDAQHNDDDDDSVFYIYIRTYIQYRITTLFYSPTSLPAYLPIRLSSWRVVMANSYARVYPLVGLGWIGFFFFLSLHPLCPRLGSLLSLPL